jgi:hypothetical protein
MERLHLGEDPDEILQIRELKQVDPGEVGDAQEYWHIQ